MDTPASKFLIPLSYASIWGGCCTAIGTSTNVLVSGILKANYMRKKMPIAISVMAAIIAAVSLGYVPMVGAVLVGAVILLLTNCLKPKKAYQSVEWRILMLIFGMLVLGLCIEATGFAKLLSGGIIHLTDGLMPVDMKPIISLIVIYLCTSFLTEVLSNNATVGLMVSFAIGFAATFGVDPRAVCNCGYDCGVNQFYNAYKVSNQRIRLWRWRLSV